VPVARKLIARDVSLIAVWPLSLLMLLTLSASLAYVMHVCVEKPALWVRDRLAA
jgi:hypothetical protein